MDPSLAEIARLPVAAAAAAFSRASDRMAACSQMGAVVITGDGAAGGGTPSTLAEFQVRARAHVCVQSCIGCWGANDVSFCIDFSPPF
jgi:hypothetical protein